MVSGFSGFRRFGCLSVVRLAFRGGIGAVRRPDVASRSSSTVLRPSVVFCAGASGGAGNRPIVVYLRRNAANFRFP